MIVIHGLSCRHPIGLRSTNAADPRDEMPEFVVPDADPMDELRRWLAEAAEAPRALAGRETTGKVLLIP